MRWKRKLALAVFLTFTSFTAVVTLLSSIGCGCGDETSLKIDIHPAVFYQSARKAVYQQVQKIWDDKKTVVMESRLVDTNALIQKYAENHQEKYPSFHKLQQQLCNIYSECFFLTSKNVHIQATQFIPRPGEKDIGKIGYAVSPDYKSYVLIGIGRNKKKIYQTILPRVPGGTILIEIPYTEENS